MDLKFQDVEGIFHLSNYCNFFFFSIMIFYDGGY